MAFDFDRSAVLSSLPCCGSCDNVKLVVWSGKPEFKGLTKQYAFNVKDAGVDVLVRCNWLKAAVEAPKLLVSCDGWRKAGSRE